MSTIKGQNLRIAIDGTFIAFATSCTLHISQQLEASSTKDTTGNFEENELTGMAWDVSCDGLYSVATDASAHNGVDLLDLVLEGDTVGVSFEYTTGTKNRQPVASSAKYSGQAYVNDISVNAPNRANSTFTIQLTGNGSLTKGTASNSSI